MRTSDVRFLHWLRDSRQAILGGPSLHASWDGSIAVPELPLRDELYSLDQLEGHARKIAIEHQLASRRGHDELLPRLKNNHRVLLETYDLVASAAEQNHRIEPAAEWLLDNFYLIEEQIRAIRRLL